MHRALVAALATVAAMLVSGCAGGDDTAEPPAPEANGSAEVSITDFAFEPESVEVDVGAEVTWINDDAVAHTVTRTEDVVTFGEPLDDKGATATVTFDEAGTYPYVCAIHQYMRGTVVVMDA